MKHPLVIYPLRDAHLSGNVVLQDSDFLTYFCRHMAIRQRAECTYAFQRCGFTNAIARNEQDGGLKNVMSGNRLC